MDNRLKQLHFNDLLILNTNIDKYDFNVYMDNGRHFINGFCTKCEEKGCNFCPTDNNFKLQTISHAATTDDILLATGQQTIDFSGWKNDSVLFLMEGPSVGWGFYEENEYRGFKKKPTKEWYWVHDRQEKFSYPQEFKGRKYGTLFNSIVFTFNLKNAYLTNLVKCGLNNADNKYKGINEYHRKTLQNCFENFLLKEMEIIQPKIVFCFGSSVEKKLWDLYPDEYPFLVCGLPHPAGQRRGFKDEFYRHLYFTRILEGLYKVGVMTLDEAQKKFSEFLTSTNKIGA